LCLPPDTNKISINELVFNIEHKFVNI